MDLEGNVVIPIIYDYAYNFFSEGYASVTAPNGKNRHY
ncbi:WG repeat-containing protein [Paenibacillus rhizoplanae]